MTDRMECSVALLAYLRDTPDCYKQAEVLDEIELYLRQYGIDVYSGDNNLWEMALHSIGVEDINYPALSLVDVKSDMEIDHSHGFMDTADIILWVNKFLTYSIPLPTKQRQMVN